MKIQEFIIQGFQSIKDRFEVPISDDTLNLIQASNNGMGKSSIILAFYFLLCNNTEDNIESYVNWDCDSMYLFVKFEHLSHNFTIEYKYENGTSEKTLCIDKEEYTGASNVKKKLVEWFDPSIFISATALFQGVKNFVSVKDSERREHLKKVFNTDYSADIKTLDKELKDLEEGKIADKKKEILIADAKEFKLQDKKDLPFNLDEKKSYEDSKIDLDNEKKIIEKDIDTINEHNNKKDDLQKSLNKELSNRSEKTRLISSLEFDIKKLEDSINSLTNEIDELKKYKKDYSTVDKLQIELESIKFTRIKPFDESLLNEKCQELSDLKASLTQLKNTIRECKDGVCPICKKDFDSNDISHYEKDINEINTKIENAQKEIDTLKTEKENYESVSKENTENKAKKELLENKIENEKTRLETEENSNKEKLASKEQLLKAQQISLAEKQNIINKQKEEKNVINESIETLEKSIEDFELKNSDELKSKKTDIETKISDIVKLINSYNATIEFNKIVEEQNVKIQKDKIANEELKKNLQIQLDELYNQKTDLEKMKIFLRKEFPSYVISSVIKGIENSMNDFINKVYYKSLDIEINGDDDKIQVLYGQQGNKRDCIHLSGAEEGLVSLAYAYSLNKLKNYNFLCIDEVDAFMNNNNSLQLAETILSIKDSFDDIWIISNQNNVKDFYMTNGANVVSIGE